MGGVRVWLLPFELDGDELLSLLGVRSRLEAKTKGDGLAGAPPPPDPVAPVLPRMSKPSPSCQAIRAVLWACYCSRKRLSPSVLSTPRYPGIWLFSARVLKRFNTCLNTQSIQILVKRNVC